jgi:Ca-activated chloride channel family protein
MSRMRVSCALTGVVAVLLATVLLGGCVPSDQPAPSGQSTSSALPPAALRIVSGSENRTLEPIIRDYEKQTGNKIEMSYEGSVDIMNALKQEGPLPFDAVWPANGIWISMGDTSNRVKQTKSTMVTPVVFGVKKSKAEELGWVGKEVTVDDILGAIERKKLRFMMTSATQSNSGASAYLGFLNAMLGSPDQITLADLQKPQLKEKLRTILSGVNRSAGSSDFLKDRYLEAPDRYDGMVNYEALIIDANKRLVAQGKEPLYVIYPKGGLALADSPLGYVDQGDAKKRELFTSFQDYLLKPEVQSRIEELGRRTELGGVVQNPDPRVFNPAWGIATSKPLNVIRYPKPDVIMAALELYQTELKKPSVTVFALDFSSSMEGKGADQLKEAMRLLLTQAEASKYLLQLGPKDRVIVLPFSDSVQGRFEGMGPTQAATVLSQIQRLQTGGRTDIYSPAIDGINELARLDSDANNLSVVLMTDGESNTGQNLGDLQRAYAAAKKDIPVYAIMFGNASPEQLDAIAKLTGGKVFDGKADLVKAFKQVRGYN